MTTYCTNALKRLRQHEGGNLTVLLGLIMIPLALGVGVAVDYSSASNNRSLMQNALDAATLSIATLPKDTTLEVRATKLQEFYSGISGPGTATLNSFNISATGAVTASASASYSMPTNFMQLASVTSVPIGVGTSLNKEPSLIETKFEIKSASGWWNKKMSLYGKKYGATAWVKLMEINYVYNNGADPKGYGTLTSSTVTRNALGVDILTPVQQQVCTTVNVANFNNLPVGAITGTSGSQKKLTTCTSTNAPGTNGALIDVSEMEDLRLEMNVPQGNPSLLKSNDPNTSNRLYLDGVEVLSGKTVNIFDAVPCGEISNQDWEDGGNPVPAPVSQADFAYRVTGKCGYSQRPDGIRLTQ